jgi:hypothetical protein
MLGLWTSIAPGAQGKRHGDPEMPEAILQNP